MEPSTIFSICNLLSLCSWLILITIPNLKYVLNIIVPVIILMLSLIYVALILPTIANFDPSMFSTLENVKQLFQNDTALAAGWVHYLAFDLFVGIYIVKEAKRLGITRWLTTPCLLLTFMFGPTGLIVFFIMKITKVKNAEIN